MPEMTWREKALFVAFILIGFPITWLADHWAKVTLIGGTVGLSLLIWWTDLTLNTGLTAYSAALALWATTGALKMATVLERAEDADKRLISLIRQGPDLQELHLLGSLVAQVEWLRDEASDLPADVLEEQLRELRRTASTLRVGTPNIIREEAVIREIRNGEPKLPIRSAIADFMSNAEARRSRLIERLREADSTSGTIDIEKERRREEAMRKLRPQR